MPSVSGISAFQGAFEAAEPPRRVHYETPKQRRAMKAQEKITRHQAKLQKQIEEYQPMKEDHGGDPFKTLFVARLSYDTTEKKLKREFESWGAIRSVKLITCSKTGKPRGYAFIEYEHERDLKNAYKQADGKKIDGRRVMVDVERGRTVPKWLPIRLGGGRGGRKAVPPKKGDPLPSHRNGADGKGDRGGDRGDRDRDRDGDRHRDTRHRDRDGDRDRRGGDRDRRGDDRRGGDRDRRGDDRRGGDRGDRDDKRGGAERDGKRDRDRGDRNDRVKSEERDRKRRRDD